MMDDLTKSRMLLLVLLVSFVTSLATVVVTVSILEQAPKPIVAFPQTIQRVVEKVTERIEKENLKETGEQSQQVIVITDEDLIVDAVEQVSPAVVSIIATKDLPVFEQVFIDPFGGDEFLRQFFPELQIPQFQQKGIEKRQVSSGTGFFVSSDGLVATNRHVVSDTEANYTIITNSGGRYPARVLARDPVHDIAILKVDGKEFPALTLGDSNKIRIGQTVIAIGNALGEFQNTVSVGVISGLGRSIIAGGGLTGPERLQQVIQTDAAINPGNSGGPLLDINGAVIGINTAMVGGAENIGFALPVNLVKRDLEDIKTSGRIMYPFLGVQYIIREEGGILITRGDDGSEAVVPDSPAAKAGLREGDIILEVNGGKLTKENTLADIIRDYNVGDTITLKVLRDKKESEIKLTLAERTF